LVVEIHLHTILQRKTEIGVIRQLSMALPPESTLAEALTELEIHLPLDGLLLVVNGRLASTQNPLKDGDIIHIIPALSGG
jgi:sulfur carrier protein ThiS